MKLKSKKSKDTDGKAENITDKEGQDTAAMSESTITEDNKTDKEAGFSDTENESAEDMCTLKEDLIKEKDKYMRLAAEFDNYRKRTFKEKIDMSKIAGQDILCGFLPVLDDMDRAVSAVDESTDIDAVKEGIHLIYSKLKDFMTKNGVKEIIAESTEFDTDIHEAITKIPVQDPALKGKVVDVIQKGYYLNDKVIRFAKVVVGD